MNPLIIPFLNNWEETRLALLDALAQTVPDLRVLLIQQGHVETPGLDDLIAGHPDTLTVWYWDPPLPSLAATWNRALAWAWESGAGRALVCNNDIRMVRQTYQTLLGIQRSHAALFVSATGVTPEQYEAFCRHVETRQDVEGKHDELHYQAAVDEAVWDVPGCLLSTHMPGPDFSCYLITQECHQRFPFDEGFIPAYCEDVDYHRRLMLEGEGQRIFGTDLPFLHVGSGTLRAFDDMGPGRRAQWEAKISAGSRAHYRKKWGGDVNQETYIRPFDPESTGNMEAQISKSATTAYLFDQERKKWASS